MHSLKHSIWFTEHNMQPKCFMNVTENVTFNLFQMLRNVISNVKSYSSYISEILQLEEGHLTPSLCGEDRVIKLKSTLFNVN